jgi:hypothetical protein
MQKSGTATWVSGLSLRQAALIAGLAYLLNPVTFAETYAMPHLFVSDAGQTITNLAAHPHLFVAAMLSYFFSLVGDIILAWSLYVLLAPVNRALSMLAAWLQIIYAAISIAAVSNLGLLYKLLMIPDYSEKISPSTLTTQGTLLLGVFRSGWGLGLILFGFHLVVLGWLITRSTYLPRWLGWLLFLDGWAWVVDSLSIYLFPKANLDLLHVLFASELIFMIWLLGWGWRISEPAGAE